MLFLLECTNPKDSHIDSERPQFSTTESAELYFKNVRQYYYDMEELNGKNLLRLSKSQPKVLYPNITLQITMDWRTDQAFLTLDENEFFPKNGVTEVYTSDSTGVKEFIQFKQRDRNEAFATIARLYKSILNDHKLYVTLDGERYPLLHIKQDREAFRVTAYDYYRLVGLH